MTLFVCDHRVVLPTGADAFPAVGGRCTGRESRCKAKQGRRGKTALTCGLLAPTVVRFLSRVQSGRGFFGNQAAAITSHLSHSLRGERSADSCVPAAASGGAGGIAAVCAAYRRGADGVSFMTIRQAVRGPSVSVIMGSELNLSQSLLVSRNCLRSPRNHTRKRG